MIPTLAFAILLAVIRLWIGLNIPPESFQWVEAYKDVAHLFMGGLGVAWWMHLESEEAEFEPALNWQFWLFVALCIIEVAVAIFSRL